MKWIMGLLCPVLISIIASLILIFKPKRNSCIGYRTQRSMSDERIWNYANKVMSVSMIIINVAICIPAVCFVNIFLKNILAVILINSFMPICMVIIVMIITEYCIRRKFGKPRN